MDASPNGIIYLDQFTIDPERGIIICEGESLSLNPKTFDVLIALIERAGTVISKDELLERVWPGQFVEENNLTVHISSLRKLLREKKNDRRYIITVPGRGYKFVGELRYHDDMAVADAGEVGGGEPRAAGDFGVGPAKIRKGGRPLVFAVASAVLVVSGLVAFQIWRQAGSTASDVGVRSVAILPFRPLVEEHRDEALELGMSDTLISGFSRIRTVSVRPMSAVRRYTALDQDARAAGSELGVESVLEGSIQRTGERLRVSARLVRVRDGTTLWAETFDEDFTDIFDLQDSIAQKIIRALEVPLSGEEGRKLNRKYTESTEAYTFYLKGRFFWSKITPEDLLKSIEFYSQAIAIDRNYALAYAGLADSYNLLGSYGFWPMKESHPKARVAAEKAISLDEGLAEAHASLAAVIADYYWDWSVAESHFERSIELNPNYPVARNWYSQHLARMGRLNESIEESKRAQALDPVSSSANSHVGLALYRARRFEEAVAELEKALQLNPNALDAHLFLGFVYVQQGKGDGAIAEFKTAVELSGRNNGILAMLGYGYASSGKQHEAHEVLKEMGPSTSRHPLETALIYTALGDRDRAFQWLETSYLQRSWQLGFLNVDPLFDPLRGDPRFESLLRRLNLNKAVSG